MTNPMAPTAGELAAISFGRLWSNYCDVKAERDSLREQIDAMPPTASTVNKAMLEALEAVELAIVTAGSAEVHGEPCRVIHADYANELLKIIWRHIKPHTERDPVMKALGIALAKTGDAS